LYITYYADKLHVLQKGKKRDRFLSYFDRYLLAFMMALTQHTPEQQTNQPHPEAPLSEETEVTPILGQLWMRHNTSVA
jgi:hypothetical protein